MANYDGIALFVKDIKRAKEFFRLHPKGKVKVNWNTSYNKKQFERWLITCLHSKINREGKRRGRKDTESYFFEVKRISERLKSRIIVRDYELNFDAKIKAKVLNRLYTKDDF